jgi:hypothetical protein
MMSVRISSEGLNESGGRLEQEQGQDRSHLEGLGVCQQMTAHQLGSIGHKEVNNKINGKED